MKIMTPLLFALLIGAGSALPLNAVAAECTSSFYCYGNTGNAVVRVATRPPPIPPPNPRVMLQRRQAQLTLRTNRAPAPQPSRIIGSCQNLANIATQLESQAVVASKYNDRQNSIRLFKQAADARNEAARLNCR